MKYYSIAGVLFVVSLFMSKLLFAADLETYKNFRNPQQRLDQDYPVPSGNYAIKIDDRVFSMTIPQGRTAATYNRNNIDTQNYREQISEAIKVLKNDIPERSLGLIGFRRKDQTGIWPFVSTYGETGIGAAVFLPQDQTKSELYWADYRTLESLVKMTKSFNYVHDEQGNRLGKKETPRDVVVINGRQWAREHSERAAIVDLPEETVDTYYTGVTANSYIRLIVRYPYTISRYPKDKERPEWVKQSSAFIAKALSSIKISAPAGSTEPDFLTVDESQNTPIEMLAP
ncbi:MAG: hypothetical protein PHO76_05245 [Methylotenera sp.]|nr:hypothetical protein [Methylotenera sp.]MDD4926883.1 hypothetical protein [Methylotenera sp.]